MDKYTKVIHDYNQAIIEYDREGLRKCLDDNVKCILVKCRDAMTTIKTFDYAEAVLDSMTHHFAMRGKCKSERVGELNVTQLAFENYSVATTSIQNYDEDGKSIYYYIEDSQNFIIDSDTGLIKWITHSYHVQLVDK